MKNQTKAGIALVLTFIFAIISAISVTALVTQTVTQSVSWTHQTASFTVNGTSTLSSLSLGTITNTGTSYLFYHVVNTGTTMLTITASDSPSGATSVWNATSATLNAGQACGFMLTLTITAAGSDTVTFSD